MFEVVRENQQVPLHDQQVSDLHITASHTSWLEIDRHMKDWHRQKSIAAGLNFALANACALILTE